ncbi:PREDICTED: uncharacterized protein LOC106744260 [Dinoponera quadriceps]|uniref:Uncharacterized protein LOC106744260 n=1 Tax=Dinoponera quadriceps TaxID=609295 RepID=A0A6P3X7X8_DINQU|nr:PREDICTED: uncharacterized protein LOC106744260 [Dinoponera quadriceps]
MNVMSFAQEFSSLVIRYTKDPLPNPSPDNNQPANTPLTKQEVANVVSNVLATLLGISDIAACSSVKTPTTGIAGATPATPVVHNINRDENDRSACRFSSQDIQETPRNRGASTTESSIDKKTEKTTLEVFQDGKKFISRSSPAICVTNIGRSDTFVLEEHQAAEAAGDLKKLNDPFAKADLTDVLLQSLNEARMSAINFIAKLDDVKKQAFPESFAQPLNTRRLSTSDTNYGRTSIPARMRRSISDFPGTPTSSRSLSTGSQDAVDKRKNSGHASVDATSRKLSLVAPVTRSVSNLNLSSSNKSFDSGRPTKNPKYAHVQSTIPKPISSKRKAP